MLDKYTDAILACNSTVYISNIDVVLCTTSQKIPLRITFLKDLGVNWRELKGDYKGGGAL